MVCALAVRHEHSESTVMTRANRSVGICCGRHLGAIKCDRMEERNRLAAQFEQQRSHLRAVAYRMLGSVPESDDAVQETWLRLSQADCSAVENLRAWLTTVIARVSLNMLRARKSRREHPYVPDPLVSAAAEPAVLVTDSVGLALQIVLDTLAPAERLAFVLHDIMGLSFEEIAPIVARTPAAARKLASRARRRVREHAPVPDRDVVRQHAVVDAFFATAHDGDFDRLVAVLAPDVVLRSDAGPLRPAASVVVRGPNRVGARAVGFARLGLDRKPVLVNGAAGVVVFSEGRPFSVMAFTIVGAKIVEIDILADGERLRYLFYRDAAGNL